MKYLDLVKTLDGASRQLFGRAAAVVNQALLLRNWLTGAYIIEFEQHGEDRASYGTRLVDCLAQDLAGRDVKGVSPTNLRLCREFYRAYPQMGEGLHDLLPAALAQAIQQTLSVESTSRRGGRRTIQQTPSVKSTRGRLILAPNLLFQFSWSKIIELLRLDDPLKRAFYENECLKGNWSVRQLQRQIGSLLYERTGLSTNQRTLVARAHSQEPQQAIDDLIRDPYILEFTGLAGRPEYTESDLESALLNHLQGFLLVLGVGFCFVARQSRKEKAVPEIMSPSVKPFSLKNAPALIERLLPVQKLSAEAYKEQMAGSGKTLTALGSYWKGLKPLILGHPEIQRTVLAEFSGNPPGAMRA